MFCSAKFFFRVAVVLAVLPALSFSAPAAAARRQKRAAAEKDLARIEAQLRQKLLQASKN